MQRISPVDMMQQHETWQNPYIGLGAVGNPVGLPWDDVGRDAAKRWLP